MKIRYLLMIAIAVLLIGSLFAGAVQALDAEQAPLATRATLENVRAYSPAVEAGAPNYAIDAGVLFAGTPGSWTEVRTPDNVIVGAVAVDSTRPDVVYIGAANELTIYRTVDQGKNWLAVPLSDDAGGVTDIAVDGLQRLMYAGTDSAGVFRLRDVGESVILGGQLLLDEPVRQVVSDSSGANLAFVRTDTALYRAENYGLSWKAVDNLHSNATAVEVADGDPATVYVGTTDRGVVESADGLTWTMANEGLGMTPGSRLHVDALAVDPTQANQLYVASSYLLGSTTVHQTPSQVAISTDGAETWTALQKEFKTSVAELLPVSGMPGGVLALTTESRTPLALYDVQVASELAAPELASAPATIVPGQPLEGIALESSDATRPALNVEPFPVAWLISLMAALALAFLVALDLRQRGVRPLAERIPLSALDTQTLTTQALSTQTLPTVG